MNSLSDKDDVLYLKEAFSNEESIETFTSDMKLNDEQNDLHNVTESRPFIDTQINHSASSTSFNVEWIDLLSRDKKVIGEMTRSIMRTHGLVHKATYLIVHDIDNQVLVQKRTMIKDYYPGFLDAAAGGVVQLHEDWLSSIKREAEEELGISDIPFSYHGEYLFTTDSTHIVGRLYSCICRGPFALQQSEIDSVSWMAPEEILKLGERFTPDSLFFLKQWLNRC